MIFSNESKFNTFNSDERNYAWKAKNIPNVTLNSKT